MILCLAQKALVASGFHCRPMPPVLAGSAGWMGTLWARQAPMMISRKHSLTADHRPGAETLPQQAPDGPSREAGTCCRGQCGRHA
ncbi:hypothetical protein FAIPA1_320049 [Frankia sp. AiPs1]